MQPEQTYMCMKSNIYTHTHTHNTREAAAAAGASLFLSRIGGGGLLMNLKAFLLFLSIESYLTLDQPQGWSNVSWVGKLNFHV